MKLLEIVYSLLLIFVIIYKVEALDSKCKKNCDEMLDSQCQACADRFSRHIELLQERIGPLPPPRIIPGDKLLISCNSCIRILSDPDTCNSEVESSVALSTLRPLRVDYH